MPKQSEKKGIVLNHMYAGSYLSSNLGHEVINMYQADNGKYYIYLNSKGNFARKHSNKIDKMLFVKHYVQGVFEVIGKAEGLEDVPGAKKSLSRDVKFDGVDKEIFKLQKDYVDNEGGVSYGGKSIFAIFNDAEQQSIFITYEAKKVYRTTKGTRIFICCKENLKNKPNLLGTISEEKEHNIEIIELPEYNQALSSFKQYIYPTNEKSYESYGNLLNLINEKSLWEDNIKKVDRCELKSPRKVSLFDICQIQNNENCFSNALAYFMTRPEYYELWRNFFDGQCKIFLSKNFSVEREVNAKIKDNDHGGGRIDLLISDENNIVVIENKIKSDINTIDSDKDNSTQLNRYVKYVESLIQKDKEENNKEEEKKQKFLILTPKYNIPTISKEMGEKYTIITYAELYSYLEKNLLVFYNDTNFVAFFEAMKRHTYENVNDYLYYEMQKKFFRRIFE